MGLLQPSRSRANTLLSYLADLQAKLARLEQSQRGESSASISRPQQPQPQPQQQQQDDAQNAERHEVEEQHVQPTMRSSPEGTRESSPGREQPNPDGTDLTNPLIESPSKFMASSTGRPCKSAPPYSAGTYLTLSSLSWDLFQLVVSRTDSKLGSRAHSQVTSPWR